jgi:hypothetical protein
MPAALEPVFRTYPMIPGSSWTWRVTHRGAGVRWAVVTITETVRAVWLAGPDRALVEVDVEEKPQTPMAASYIPIEPSERRIYREVDPAFVLLDEYRRGTSVPGQFHPRITVEPLLDHFDSGSDEIRPEESAFGVSVTTRGGAFDGCTRLSVVGGGGWENYRWFCPGVGYVRDERYTCYSNAGDFTLSELVRWSIGQW